uniref:Uncharacterized protein n=1 Tax=Haptolina ericina TaxID=156174 RepID=A0A7S3BHH6_9EUKA|mmetsp:Transcript_60175/g.134061  ORF Transcript_60175/g.134061 Transcript_60175/m.134061 type:complete len:229 (+) Transcript_60175:79-765(+)
MLLAYWELLLACCTIFIVVVFSSRPRLVGGVLFAGCAILVHLILLQQKVVGSFGGHFLPGTLIVRVGRVVLQSEEGGLVHIPFAFAVVGATGFGLIIVGELVTAGISHFYNWVHLMMYSVGAALSLSMGMEDVTARTKSRVAAVRVRNLRAVCDPLLLAASGALQWTHVHDQLPMAVMMHTTLGKLLVTLAAVQLLSSLAHERSPANGGACTILRILHASCWVHVPTP